jgi:hypothetical protein
VKIDPETLEIAHAYEESLSGRTLAVEDGHDIGEEYLRYNNRHVATF